MLRVITLGDRFSLQDFYDRIKKGFVEFLIVFFGVLVSFGVESQGEDFDDRESNIDNLVGLRDEMIDIKEYTQIYIEENQWIRNLYAQLYQKWEIEISDDFTAHKTRNVKNLQWKKSSAWSWAVASPVLNKYATLH